ncbi:hypothetical protein [Stigmatella aurantiaca]|uniref:Uncharacterized protein n=1 Tax=Stigmatella aurantiaca (strain DW4/3-1) TaxID=378806 RepID=Q08X13_STIAD|nr:hypothetical protein [Stigmatella aurantiaca]ADO75977.1 uncharacterized protein STAUR_8222 [Stigmatella aurantiaca DW4/3-1]EAU65039.1 hypothetical protein STIAU_3180 [Stigmatella aurantiaca DW4/3-1]
MQELDKKFVEPVVLGNRPFEMVADVARDAMVRTHKLVTALTAAKDGQAAVAEHADSEQSSVKLR